MEDHRQLIGEGNGAHAREGPHALGDGSRRTRATAGWMVSGKRSGVTTTFRGRYPGSACRLRPRIGEQPGGHQQHHAHPHLCGDQPPRAPLPPPKGRPRLSSNRQVHLDGFERGGESAKNAGEQHDGGDVEEDAPIGIHAVSRGTRREVAEEWLGHVADQLDAGGAGDRGHDQALCDQHANQADARRAEGEAHRDLATARSRAREQERGNIRASDQQHEVERAEKKGQQEQLRGGRISSNSGSQEPSVVR